MRYSVKFRPEIDRRLPWRIYDPDGNFSCACSQLPNAVALAGKFAERSRLRELLTGDWRYHH